MNIFEHCRTISTLPFKYEPEFWNDCIEANCYEYLLNYKNKSDKRLILGDLIDNEFKPYYSNEDLIKILIEEMSLLGFSVTKATYESQITNNELKFFITRSRCGDYHFYRLDIDLIWSNKFSFDLPSDLDFFNKKILTPHLVCTTDISVGYFILRFKNPRTR